MLRVLLFMAALPALAAEPDALAISLNIAARHLPYDTILDPVFDAGSNTIAGYSRCGDSALWSGTFLASEAFHYRVTGSAEALANVKRVLHGLGNLIDAPGTGLLARCALPVDSPYVNGIVAEESHNGIYYNNGFLWVGNTSRDEYSGLFFGLGVAHDLVNETEVRSAVNDLATRALKFLMSTRWTIVMPDGKATNTFLLRPDQQLALLQVGRRINPREFAAAYAQYTGAAGLIFLPIAVDAQDPHNSYFKFNLDTINLYSLIHNESGFANRFVYGGAYTILRNVTRTHENAFFNMIDRALEGADPVRDQSTLEYLDQWLTRPRRDVYVDLRAQYPACHQDDEACQIIPIPLRVTTDFVWQRSPFLLYGGGSGAIEGAGIDYTLPYWMARYYGLTGR